MSVQGGPIPLRRLRFIVVSYISVNDVQCRLYNISQDLKSQFGLLCLFTHINSYKYQYKTYLNKMKRTKF